MIELKRFSGLMNNDDSPADILPPYHIAAKNVRFRGGGGAVAVENILGNRVINNADLPAGTNECIGAFFDDVNQRILWFNYNSNGDNGIYQLLIQTGVVSKIFLCNTDSATDIFNFSLDYPVHSASIVYRTEGDGDLLYWTDGYNRPRYLNLDTVASLAPFTEDMINAAKNAPLTPPSFPAAPGTNNVFGYFSDATVNYNAVKNKFFRFSYRWVYKNGEKSTLSPISEVALPYIIDPNIQDSATIFNYIKFVVYSPDQEDYQAIEVFGQQSTGTTWGDFFLIDKLDRDEYNIPISSSFTYSFYNDGSYIFIDPTESDLYFDWLPDKANTLALLNGNVIIYGGITDGYANLERSEVDVTITSSLVSPTPLLSTIPNVFPSFKWNNNERFGLIYFDDRGKTSGVISYVADAIDTTDFAVTTPNYPGQSPTAVITVPEIQATINHTPPTWAVSYQWVRVNLTPKFIQWVTNDYQTDAQYAYLGIEALVQMNAKSGFIPSYEYSEGDRVRIMARVTGDNNTTVYSTQYDFPILEVVQRTMTSPASLGAFLKIPKPGTIPSPGYQSLMFIEIYTPKQSLPDNLQLFYEWGQKYDIYEDGGNRYHRGQLQDQTAVQAATFAWTNGDVYLKRRGYFVSVPIEANVLYSFADFMDANFNDYVPSASNANGRAWVINENAKQEYNSVLVRWGGKYQSGTNINALNRFRPSDFDEVDRAKGDIRRLAPRDRLLRVFQDRGVGQYGVYARFIQNNQGEPELVTTNEIITTNNIQYYRGNYGLCGYPTNLVSTQVADYFTDVVTGRDIRLSYDGITDLGMLYKGQYTFPRLVTPYNKQLLRSNGSIAKVMKFFDFFEGDCHTILQAGSADGVETDDQHWSFNEKRNAFSNDRYGYHPEWAIGANDIIYTWRNGLIYKHDSEVYCNFYGEQDDCDITFVFNDNLVQKKTWHSITEIATDTWDCPEIYTNTMSYGTQRQQTNLVAAEFVKLEQNPSASIKRDANSRGGKINGGTMKGNFCVIRFRKENAVNLINLEEISVSYVDSPLTTK